MDALLLSKQEAARTLGLSIRSLEHLISPHEIPTRRIGRRVLIMRSAVESFAKGAEDRACEEPQAVRATVIAVAKR